MGGQSSKKCYFLYYEPKGNAKELNIATCVAKSLCAKILFDPKDHGLDYNFLIIESELLPMDAHNNICNLEKDTIEKENALDNQLYTALDALILIYLDKKSHFFIENQHLKQLLEANGLTFLHKDVPLPSLMRPE